ncbi:NADP-dependent oxidoreductase [Falsibacillus albus]|uniref:NADP-dependent oxidoreductase n=1 Tax=Falsibacillus albus TaxID=2478915 RepID=A0A3L7JKG9_9BACI|nr:NADP-dependent oxidoreductase [Falsibacillus albus]RLQ90629.1 NADP-dependent oxidoreductase [Falsibacillus albus]
MNRQIHLVERPKAAPTHEHFNLVETSIPKLGDQEVLIHNLYLSVDPYMRGRMSDAKSYVPPFKLNEKLVGGVVGEVVESNSDQFQTGDVVTGMLGWEEYSIAPEKEIRKVNPELAPVTTSLGILGLTGLTAYFGLIDICQPKEGETVVVSGAAGAVGSVVGQIAKIKGARVVGIAGSDEKIDYIKNELGFDEAINYKTTENIQEALEKACPNGVDAYFDNVGGEISDAVLNLLNKFARIAQCGAISSYNKVDDQGPRIQTKLIKSSALIKGFIVSDYAERFKEGAEQLGQWLQQGKLKYEETITEGFENIPDAFLGLFEGNNLGKQLVKIGEPQHAKL